MDIDDDLKLDPTQRLQSLVRGLTVLALFSDNQPCMSIANAAEVSGLSRATVRRIMLTLEEMGFVRRSSKREFCVTRRVLNLASVFISPFDYWQSVEPKLEDLVSKIDESCSISILDDLEIVYVARVTARRILGLRVEVGSRLPVLPTSMGRVLLSDVPTTVLKRALTASKIEKFTENTLTDPSELRHEIEKALEHGFAVVDGELEEGLISMAVPIKDSQGRVIAALGTSSHTGRMSCKDFVKSSLEPMKEAAKQIGLELD